MLRFDEKQLSRMKGLENENPLASNDISEIESSIDDNEDMASDAFLENDEDSESDGDFENLEIQAPAAKSKDWRRVRKTYKRSKQYIFVAATLPVNGKATAGGVLKRLYPEASWVTGNYVHRHNPRCIDCVLQYYISTYFITTFPTSCWNSQSRILEHVIHLI